MRFGAGEAVQDREDAVEHRPKASSSPPTRQRRWVDSVHCTVAA
jgi:hypothetical protein